MKALSLATAVISTAMLLPPPVLAGETVASQYRLNFDRDVCTAMDMAARFLVDTSRPAGTHGGPAWPWQVDEGPRADNVAGLAALALLEAYRTSGNPAYLAVANDNAFMSNLPSDTTIITYVAPPRLQDT